jgi:hypothetical protein
MYTNKRTGIQQEVALQQNKYIVLDFSNAILKGHSNLPMYSS